MRTRITGRPSCSSVTRIERGDSCWLAGRVEDRIHPAPQSRSVRKRGMEARRRQAIRSGGGCEGAAQRTRRRWGCSPRGRCPGISYSLPERSHSVRRGGGNSVVLTLRVRTTLDALHHTERDDYTGSAVHMPPHPSCPSPGPAYNTLLILPAAPVSRSAGISPCRPGSC
jgi:hypothetical protein